MPGRGEREPLPPWFIVPENFIQNPVDKRRFKGYNNNSYKSVTTVTKY